MSTKMATITTRFGLLRLTQFVGPEELGQDRRCLQVGDDVRLTLSDARRLVVHLEEWMLVGSKEAL